MVIFLRNDIAKSAWQVVLAGTLCVLGFADLPAAFAQGAAGEASAPLILRSTLENLSRGFIPAGLPPALRIKSGQTVQIETFSHHGFVDDPVAFFKGYGISPEMVLPDLIGDWRIFLSPREAGRTAPTVPVSSAALNPATHLKFEYSTLSRGCHTAGMAAGRDAVSFPISLLKPIRKKSNSTLNEMWRCSTKKTKCLFSLSWE